MPLSPTTALRFGEKLAIARKVMKTQIMRIKSIITGKVSWIDEITGEITEDREDWRTRWALFGVHSHNWWWVRKYGQLECGCTINPITRRRVLTLWGCKTHCDVEDDAWLDDWEDDEEWESWG